MQRHIGSGLLTHTRMQSAGATSRRRERNLSRQGSTRSRSGTTRWHWPGRWIPRAAASGDIIDRGIGPCRFGLTADTENEEDEFGEAEALAGEGVEVRDEYVTHSVTSIADMMTFYPNGCALQPLATARRPDQREGVQEDGRTG
jgi:hypothetical protein